MLVDKKRSVYRVIHSLRVAEALEKEAVKLMLYRQVIMGTWLAKQESLPRQVDVERDMDLAQLLVSILTTRLIVSKS